jgi:hypothetical protein
VFGSEYMAAATTASAEAMRVVSPAALVHRLRSHGSSWMGADDINHILRIQFMATHSGVPYMEDFYFQVSVFLGGGALCTLMCACVDALDEPGVSTSSWVNIRRYSAAACSRDLQHIRCCCLSI